MASLAKNTSYLYLLTASNYIFGLITVPYISRIFGPSIYGDLGFAIAIGAYFQLCIDFGFILSATRRVACNCSNKLELSRIVIGVSTIKTIIAFVLLLLIIITESYINAISNNFNIILLYLVLAYVNSLLPDYIYRGLEKMKIITIRGVAIKALFVALTFIFLKDSNQLYFVPLFQLIGSLLALVWIIYDIKVNLGIYYTSISFKYLKELLSESFSFFISRIAASIYNVANTFILGLMYPSQPIVGYYSSADRLRSLANTACSPLSDSFYPYMIRTKDFKKLFKTTLLLEIIIVAILVVTFIKANQICTIIFGSAFTSAGTLLRFMIPLMAMVLPQYMLGFPALTPIGLSKWANISVESATFNQILGLIILFYLGKITAENLCILTFTSELICLSIRIYILYKHRNLLKQ